MKKILIIAILILAAVTSYGQSLDTVNVGAYNNDPSADKARTAFIKLNRGIALLNTLRLYNLNYVELAILDGALPTTAEVNRLVGVTSAIQTQINNRIRSVDSTGNAAGNYVTRKALRDTVDTRGARIINDTLTWRLATATVGVALADSNIFNGGYTTRTYVESILGSGPGLSFQRLPFIVGTTSGAPSVADSTISNGIFDGKHIDIYRNGTKQYYNSTATNTVDGFRITGDNIVVNPAWQDDEQVIIDISDAASWETLSFASSSLLTGLVAYWNLDETTGVVADDKMNIYDGTIVNTPTLSSSGIEGTAYHFSTASNEYVSAAAGASDFGTGDFSISCWVNAATMDSVRFIFGNGISGTEYLLLYVDPVFNNFTVLLRMNNVTTEIATSISGHLPNVWNHIVITADRDGLATIYCNNVAGPYPSSIAAYSAIDFSNTNNFIIGAATTTGYLPFHGSIDEFGIWTRILTGVEIATLYNAGSGLTHPFN